MSKTQVSETTKEVTPRRFVCSMYPCGQKSFCIEIQDRANDPDLSPGDRCVFDPELDIVPFDFIVVAMDGGHAVVSQVVFGTNGDVILRATNDGWPSYRFTAEEWASRVEVLGVMTEHSRPRRACGSA